MPKKPIAPRISDRSAEFYPQIFSSLHFGTTYTLDAFPALYQRTLHDLRGKFGQGELSLLIDVFNSTMLTPQLAGQHLYLQAQDGMELDGLDEKWAVDREAFLKKLDALPVFAAACLEIWANGFWYREKNQDKDLTGDDFRVWMEPLLKKEEKKA